MRVSMGVDVFGMWLTASALVGALLMFTVIIIATRPRKK